MDMNGAFEVIEKLNLSSREFKRPPWISNAIAAFNVFFYLTRGNLNAAIKPADERGLTLDGKLANLREPEYMALVHILMPRTSTAN